MPFFAKLTAGGAALLAAATVGDPVELSTLVIGNGGGFPTEPTGAEVELVNQVAAFPLDSAGVDPADPDVLVVSGIVPANVGGFTVREVGIKTAGGVLFAIASFPATAKPDPVLDGAALDLIISLRIAYAGEPNIVVSVDESTVFASRDYVLGARHYFAVKSATTAAPPGAPANGDHYLIPADPAGAWVGQADRIAVWRVGPNGWLFINAPIGAKACAADTGTDYRRTQTGWAASVESPDLYLWSAQGA